MAESESSVRFPIEAIASAPGPGMAIPSAFAFSPDDRELTYLAPTGAGAEQQLYTCDTQTGARHVRLVPPGGGIREESLSPEEELRRQRERSLAVGITRYGRAEHARRIVVPLHGDVYVQDGPAAPPRQIVDHGAGAPALTPMLAPDGRRVAYVCDDELYVVPATGGRPRQITRGARGTGRTHGLAEYIAQEELDRSQGFWWAPDSRRLAFTEVDERHIPVYRIMHQGKDTTGSDAQEDHRYPFAGGPNALVRLGVVAARGGPPVWMDLDPGDGYLARVFWWRDGSLGAVTLNREQTVLDLLRFDPQTGHRATVLQERSPRWVNLSRKPLTPLDDGRFLWLSERSGFQHVYLYDREGTLIRQLTDGAWMVDAVRGVDERGAQVYVTGNREHPTETQLYAVPLAGGDVRRVTTAPGTHEVTLDHAGRRFVDVHSALDRPPSVTLRALADGAVLHTLHTPHDERIAAFGLEPPELVTLRNRAGTTLYGALYRPPARFGTGPYPTIVHVYGGPHSQQVTDGWGMTAALQLQYLRNLGFLVFRLDNRGSARRGVAFESALARRMGSVEVDDQVDGVRWLVEQGLADPTRVGVTGWSYGGYMALLCLAKAPETFRVAVAGAPVTSWDGYDTAYTERYMGTPSSNPAGYAAGSVLAHVNAIQGRLLIVHGLLDENVHFRHTARLINALTRARKLYDTLLFPDERHMPRHHADRVYLNERIVGYFQQHL